MGEHHHHHHHHHRRPEPVPHFDLGKEHRKLLHHYEEISKHPVDETKFFSSYLAKHKKSGEYRTVRIVPKKKMHKSRFSNEVGRFQELYHPNVVHLYETLEDRKHYYFVSDRIDHPNIYQAIPKLFPNPQDFDEVQVALLVRTILRALNFCHKNQFPHTNLSYHDILVDPNQRGLKGLCIVGFGYARLRQEETVYQHRKSMLAGSPGESDDSSDSEEEEDHSSSNGAIPVAPEDCFAAPETRAGDLSIYESPSDLWSVGIITYQLLTRHHPFEDPEVRPKCFENNAWREDHFRNHPFLTNVTAPARDFVKQLLTYKDGGEGARPTAEEALEHEWLKHVDNVGSRAKKEALLDSLENLTTFDSQNKLEMIARLYISNHLLYYPEKLSLQSIFKHLDRNHDKVITKDELKNALEKAHGKQKQVKILELMETSFDQVDVDGNGKIDYLEFLAAAADVSLLFTKKNLRAAFDALDISKTGTITKQDLQDLCEGEVEKKFMSRREVRHLLRQADEDGDGEIDFDEFCTMMRRTR